MNFKNINLFIFLCSIYLLCGAFLIYYFPKGEIELLVNAKYTIYLDIFFKFWTYVGDGLTLTGVVFVLLFVNYYFCIVGASVGIVHTIIIHLLKQKFFADAQRPFLYFKSMPNLTLHLVDGVEIYEHNSFPSGHTSTAFAMVTFIVLVLLIRFGSVKPLIQIGLFAIAFLVGASRIYLFQHFFIDTYFGAIIGILSAIVIVYTFERTNLRQKLRERSLLNSKK